MSRRICLLLVTASFALTAPAKGLAQSSSQAQYQGVAPETSLPVTGSGGTPGNTSGGSATPSSGATGSGGSNATGGSTSGASGNGGTGAGAPTASGGSASGGIAVTPHATSDTAPFSG